MVSQENMKEDDLPQKWMNYVETLEQIGLIQYLVIDHLMNNIKKKKNFIKKLQSQMQGY